MSQHKGAGNKSLMQQTFLEALKPSDSAYNQDMLQPVFTATLTMAPLQLKSVVLHDFFWAGNILPL